MEGQRAMDKEFYKLRGVRTGGASLSKRNCVNRNYQKRKEEKICMKQSH